MKKTFPVNINGKIFYIDEDAYELLLNYLNQLRSAFSGTEGDEIVADIESRISELFDERIASGANVIVYSDVNRMIEIMGKPSDISDASHDTADNNGNQTDSSSSSTDSHAPGSGNSSAQAHKRPYRNINNKVFGGVFGGLATYFGWDANILRILVTIIAVMTYLWPMIILYLIAWMIIPPANTPRRILEMQGNPVTVDTIGQNVLSSTPPPYYGIKLPIQKNSIEKAFSILGKCIMGFFGLIGTVGALVSTGFFLFFFAALIASTCFHSVVLLEPFVHNISVCSITFVSTIFSLACMAFSLCFTIPSIALAWAGASFLFNCKAATKITIITAVVLELIFIVATFILMIFSDRLIHDFSIINC